MSSYAWGFRALAFNYTVEAQEITKSVQRPLKNAFCRTFKGGGPRSLHSQPAFVRILFFSGSSRT